MTSGQGEGEPRTRNGELDPPTGAPRAGVPLIGIARATDLREFDLGGVGSCRRADQAPRGRANQVVDVYPSGTAPDAVAEARERVDCTDYVTPQGFEVSGVKELKLPAVKGAKAQFGWCEDVKGVSQCHAVIATDDLVTRLWLISDPISDTKEGIAAFTLLAGARLVDQP